MGSVSRRQKLVRRTQLECLEDRVVMTADPWAALASGSLVHHVQPSPDFQLGDTALNEDPFFSGELGQHLASAHGQTGLFDVRNDYGFIGTGQTVAIIDSGIAYDHAALGGGLGANYRVVGGWDFTEENDADPYDDGPAGSHGTHVAGIVGASGGVNEGVAPGVDLVGLRVFNDAGSGFFSWVETALDWIHDEHVKWTNNAPGALENPITTVNLSLGVEANLVTPPTWAMLEDEFAQLKADGIVVTVSAGNSFTNYNTPGLSYPAVSPHVVPVMSVDDNGQLSYFSQRHTTAIAAPGRQITSTVPDYDGNNNGNTDDYGSKSGTSMAAPYLAGAGVLVREAMEFVGQSNINQDSIYAHLRNTADDVFDSATNAWYKRLNMSAAIDALMPADDYGSTVATAANLGTISNTASVSGLVGQLSDTDFFSFTAGVTGTFTVTATGTHQFGASWQLDGGGGTVSGTNGEVFSFDVAAGQTYAFGLSTDDGIGYYDLDMLAESSLNYTDWGLVTFLESNDQANSGEQWYRIQASQTGTLTVEAIFNQANGNLNVELYDQGLQLLATAQTQSDGKRLDAGVGASAELFLRVDGNNNNIDFRVNNLLSQTGNAVNVSGTSGADTYSFSAGSFHQLVVNGTTYSFNSSAVSEVNFSGGGALDTVTLTGDAGNDTATLRVSQAQLAGNGYTANATGIETVAVFGGGGTNIAHLYDSSGSDTYTAQRQHQQMIGSGFNHVVQGFRNSFGYSTAGSDVANMYDGTGDDHYASWHNQVAMTASDFYNYAWNFDTTHGFATTGNDTAVIIDSAGDDQYSAWHDRVSIEGNGFHNEANNFDRTFAHSNGGQDTAHAYDSSGDDQYVAWTDLVVMSGNGYYNWLKSFETTTGHGSTGDDVAVVFDSAGDDQLVARPELITITGSGFSNSVADFGRTYTYASTGDDTSIMYDSSGDDRYITFPDRVLMISPDNLNYAGGFDSTFGYASTGNDVVTLYDSPTDDTFVARHNRVVLHGDGFYNLAEDFDSAHAFASNGFDSAVMYDSEGDDTYTTYHNRVLMQGTGFYNLAQSFDNTFGYASGGNDSVLMFDSSGDDFYQTWHDHVVMQGSGFFNYAADFETAYGFASTGNDMARMYDSAGNDEVLAAAWGVSMLGSGYYTDARGFDVVEAHGTNGGNNTATTESIDYIFNLIGAWT